MTNPKSRWILHCDCNSFYASVELLEHPELCRQPVAVCGDPEGRHGIVLAKNEAAKKYGVRTAETIWQARRKCPDLVLLPPHRDRYRHFCNIINNIYLQYTDLVEPFSIDESWLDVTHSFHLFCEHPAQLADRLRRQVKETTGLTISVGVSFNKVFAKLGSDYKKPDATTLISLENYRQVVWPLPVDAMLYVGSSARQTLQRMGISTIGQLAGADPRLLESTLGKLGGELSRFARGEDAEPVRPFSSREPVKSVGNGQTFRRNLEGEADCRAALISLCDQVAARLRRSNLWAGGVQITIRDPDFRVITRQKQLEQSTHLARELFQASWELLSRNWNFANPIRMLTVTALSITDEPFAVQQSFFEDAPKPDPRREKLEKSLDSIRQKYGSAAVTPASLVKNQLGLPTPKIQDRPEEEDEGFARPKGPL